MIKLNFNCLICFRYIFKSSQNERFTEMKEIHPINSTYNINVPALKII